MGEKSPVISCHSEHHCMHHHRFQLKLSSSRLFKHFFFYSTSVEKKYTETGHKD